jgi:hypothetical protein
MKRLEKGCPNFFKIVYNIRINKLEKKYIGVGLCELAVGAYSAPRGGEGLAHAATEPSLDTSLRILPLKYIR